jgi:hypothetical protein
MGSGLIGEPNDFSISPESTILSFTLANNLYWNGQKSVPAHEFDGIQYNADSNAFLVNPQLPDIPTNITLPRLNPVNGLLGGQFHSVREVFVYLVQTYGTPAGSSPVIDKADPLHTPDDDILGLPRQAGGLPDLGAVEIPK